MTMPRNYLWPLPEHEVEIPCDILHPGSFGARRKHDVHTGIDLYAPFGQPVIAIEDGIVVAIEPLFTGGEDTPKDSEGSPIWLPTSAVLVEGASGVIAYGEIEPDVSIRTGVSLTQGDLIGTVLQVLKPKKDGVLYKNPANSPTMLHLELYTHGSRKTVYWHLKESQPETLLDPTPLLTNSTD